MTMRLIGISLQLAFYFGLCQHVTIDLCQLLKRMKSIIRRFEALTFLKIVCMWYAWVDKRFIRVAQNLYQILGLKPKSILKPKIYAQIHTKSLIYCISSQNFQIPYIPHHQILNSLPSWAMEPPLNPVIMDAVRWKSTWPLRLSKVSLPCHKWDLCLMKIDMVRQKRTISRVPKSIALIAITNMQNMCMTRTAY